MKIDINKINIGDKVRVSEGLKTHPDINISNLVGKFVTINLIDYEWNAVKIKEYATDAYWDPSCFDAIIGVKYV